MKQLQIELYEAGCIDREGNDIPGMEAIRNQIIDHMVAQFEQQEREFGKFPEGDCVGSKNVHP